MRPAVGPFGRPQCSGGPAVPGPSVRCPAGVVAPSWARRSTSADPCTSAPGPSPRSSCPMRPRGRRLIPAAKRRSTQERSIEDMSEEERLKRLQEVSEQLGPLESVYDTKNRLRELGIPDLTEMITPEDWADESTNPYWADDWDADPRQQVYTAMRSELLEDGLQRQLVATQDVEEEEPLVVVRPRGVLQLVAAKCQGRASIDKLRAAAHSLTCRGLQAAWQHASCPAACGRVIEGSHAYVWQPSAPASVPLRVRPPQTPLHNCLVVCTFDTGEDTDFLRRVRRLCAHASAACSNSLPGCVRPGSARRKRRHLRAHGTATAMRLRLTIAFLKRLSRAGSRQGLFSPAGTPGGPG
jgi:hypothetical protein